VPIVAVHSGRDDAWSPGRALTWEVGQVTAPQPQTGYGAPAAPNNTLGLISMILGIVAIVLSCCFGAGIIFGAVAAVLGYLGKQKVAQGQATNPGQAQAGFITGIVAVGLSLLWIVFTIVLNVSFLPSYGM
jgi:hypothetical protein